MRSFECGKSLFPIRKKKIIALTFKTSIIIPHRALNSCNVHLHINLLKVLTVRWSRNIKKKLTSKQSTRGSYIKNLFLNKFDITYQMSCARSTVTWKQSTCEFTINIYNPLDVSFLCGTWYNFHYHHWLIRHLKCE